MRKWLSLGGFFLALALFWAGAELSSVAQSAAPGRGTPLQFSGRADATNSFGDLNGPTERSESLDDGLFGLSKPISPRGSMQGVAPVITIRRSVPSKELRDLLDRRRNWLFANPESLPGGLNAAEQSTTLEELKKGGKLTAVEQYYLELTRQQNGASAGKEPMAAEAAQRQDDTAKLPPTLREREQELKRLLSTELDNADRSPDLFSGTLQKEQQQPGPRSIIAPVSRSTVEAKRATAVDQYRELLGLPTTALAVSDLFKAPGALPERQSSAQVPGPQTPSAPVVLPSSRSLTASEPGQAPEAPAAAEVPRAPTPAGAVTTAKADVPKRTPPPTPTFTAPRRMF